ncbi:MAG TPA: DHCW motif cupin fold protein [Cyclobacteriaceae bacterium]
MMETVAIPFQVTDWSTVPVTEHKGETGIAYWRTWQSGDLRVRLVEYSANYLADHWCEKGHVLFCIEGEMISELSDGSKFILTSGMSYQVSDGLSSHRSVSKNGVKLLIVDGGFLKT